MASCSAFSTKSIKMAFVGVIPSRYASTRFPGKPLALIQGKPMVQWVYERSRMSALDQVVVATDDDRIFSAVQAFHGEVVMTASTHRSGTERCAEVARSLNLQPADIVVNIQGDEPFISPDAIRQLTELFRRPEVRIATLAKEFLPEEEPANPNMVKVVCDRSGRALYFSRSPIPYYRNTQVARHHFRHVGIYAYRCDVLQQLVALPASDLEDAEQLEQLRWLDNGYDIFVSPCTYDNISIDTPEDLTRAEVFAKTFIKS